MALLDLRITSYRPPRFQRKKALSKPTNNETDGCIVKGPLILHVFTAKKIIFPIIPPYIYPYVPLGTLVDNSGV